MSKKGTEMIDERKTIDPYQPRIRWEGMEDYVEGSAVLARDTTRQLFGYRQSGQWHELVDGDEYAIDGFDPVEWCDPPGGTHAWG